MTDFFEGTDQVSDNANTPAADQANGDQSNAELQMIGEGKKYKGLEDADKALQEKERFIKQLETENAQLRGAVTKSDTLDKALKLIAQEKEQNQQTSVTPTTRAETVASEFTPEKIEEMARTVYQKETARQISERNRLEVATKIKQIYGTRSEEFLGKRAKELNLSIDEIKDLAGKSPQAALNILVPPAEPSKTTGYSYTPSGQTRSVAAYNAAQDETLNKIRQEIKLGKRPSQDLDAYLNSHYKR